MSNNDIPITYQVFSENTSDCETVNPTTSITENYNIGRIVVIADKKLNTSENAILQIHRGDGYIYSQNIRGSNAEYQSYVLDETGYEHIGNEGFKLKSRVFRRAVNILEKNKEIVTEEIDELQVVFYSPKQAKRSKKKRIEAIEKAWKLIKNPEEYNSSEHYGAKRYIKGIEFNAKSGELIENCKKHLTFDYEKVKEEEKFDGYYSIVSSELNEKPERIVELYKGLWKIEETFKITKSVLDLRPMYLSRDEDIRAHFMICFVSLVITRLLERELDNLFTIDQIAESLKKLTITRSGRLYACSHYDEVIKAIVEKMGLQLDYETWSLKRLTELFSKRTLRKNT